MPDLCPLCGQSLPAAISQSELKARVQRMTSPALLAEKKRLNEQFEAASMKIRQDAERQFQQRLRAAENVAQ